MYRTINWSRIAVWSKERVPHVGSAFGEEVTVDKQPYSYFLAHSVNLQLQMTVNLWLFLGQWLGVPAVKVKSFIKVRSWYYIVHKLKIIVHNFKINTLYMSLTWSKLFRYRDGATKLQRHTNGTVCLKKRGDLPILLETRTGILCLYW